MTYRKIGFLLVAAGILLITIAISTHPAFRLATALPDAFGFREPKKYLVLLQNNTELRPTGGFMGSFALITMNRGRPTIRVEDIYTPDGQVKGHVDPPTPIQEAFQLGEWRLRDANWDPNFPTSAQTIEWFMDKGGITDIDGTIATNLIVFEEVLKILGPIHLPDYKEVITAENLWLLGEQYAQGEFFPGSIQKRKFFSDLARETMNMVDIASFSKKIQLVCLMLRMLEEKQIIVFGHDPNVQYALESFNWAGRLRAPSCSWRYPRCIAESLMIVEANLGVNKANCCIDRSAKLSLEVYETSSEAVRHNLLLTFTNRSSKETWGGRYKAWVRIYANAREQTGFWVEVPENESRTYSVEYDLPNLASRPNLPISLLVQKQPGIVDYPITIKVESEDRRDREIRTLIRKDQLFVL